MKAIKGEYTLEISGRLKKKGERVGFGAGSTHTLTHTKKKPREFIISIEREQTLYNIQELQQKGCHRCKPPLKLAAIKYDSDYWESNIHGAANTHTHCTHTLIKLTITCSGSNRSAA